MQLPRRSGASNRTVLIGNAVVMSDLTLENRTLRKVAWRLIPFICVCYLLNILDRANVGFARLQMQDDLG